MKFSTTLAVASVALGVQAGGGQSGVSPAGGSPPGCSATGSGTYEITIVKPSGTKRSLEQRAACGGEGTLLVTLNNGILTDSKGRIGSIVANRQFQFDGPPPQAGAIYTAGWSVCGNSSLAIGPTTVFYQCLSGGFYNLYDQAVGAQCTLVNMDTIPCGGNSGTSPASGVSVASQQTDGQPTAGTATTQLVSQISDGQPQATTPALVSQISDGQPQATTPALVSQISDGQPQATAAGNGTVTSGSPVPIATGGAASFVASGAMVALGAAAAVLL